jgi:hypothetical protein
MENWQSKEEGSPMKGSTGANKKEVLMKRGALAILVFFFALFLCAFFDQPVAAQNTQMTITGKIIKESDGYYIQGQTPPEVFRILNPAPSRLNKLVKKGDSVEIGAIAVQGDNVDIQSINGKPYKRK